MIALFSPSEGKASGGSGEFQDVFSDLIADAESLSFLIKKYEKVLTSGSLKNRQKLTGWKDREKIDELPKNLFQAPILPALKRYSGVGYQYLDADSLSENEYGYLAKHLIIFSNLLGPLRGGDLIPETKLKQCNKFAGVSVGNYYSQHTSKALDGMIQDQPVLDLRAGVYRTYFKPKGRVVECIFQKNGKQVSHWSKAYRGLLLRYFAQHQPGAVDELLRMPTPGLEQLNYSRYGARLVITYEAVE